MGKSRDISHDTAPLTLFLPTSHLCVENTVLAFMICLLFNLSYKVTITCKWTGTNWCILPSLQPTNRINLPIFTAYHQFVLATKLKMPSFRLKNNTKTYTYLSSIFNPNINKKSTFTANLQVRPWYLTGSFPLNVFRRLYISHFIRPSLAYLKLPLSRPKRILGNPAIRRA